MLYQRHIFRNIAEGIFILVRNVSHYFPLRYLLTIGASTEAENESNEEGEH